MFNLFTNLRKNLFDLNTITNDNTLNNLNEQDSLENNIENKTTTLDKNVNEKTHTVNENLTLKSTLIAGNK